MSNRKHDVFTGGESIFIFYDGVAVRVASRAACSVMRVVRMDANNPRPDTLVSPCSAAWNHDRATVATTAL